MAAESYARIKGFPAIINVTAGPGAINAINGVFGAFVDSIPMIVISGQAKRETLICNSGLAELRQLGDQEVDIVRMVSGVCKQASVIQDPLAIADAIDDAFAEAASFNAIIKLRRTCTAFPASFSVIASDACVAAL